MFPFFKRKNTFPADCKWCVGTFEDNGKRFFFRRNETASHMAGGEYCFRVGVAIPISELDENDLPSPNEAEFILELEDILTAVLQQDEDSIHVLAVSGDAMREFVFYTRKPNDIQLRIDRIRAKFPGREIQSYIAEDRNWGCYKQYM